MSNKIKDYLEKHYKTTKLEALNDHRIGIDAVPYILRMPIKDPFQITMGGLPLTLIDILDKELDKLKKANIKPFFVFNGLMIIKERANNFQTNQIKSQKINNAWDLYYRGKYPDYEKTFLEAVEKGFYLPFIHYIISYFKQNNIEFFKAPYLAGPQLAYFSDPTQKSYLNAVFGAQELLLYGVNRLIIEIDYEKGTYVWVDLKTILQDLAITHDQFIDAFLLCGFEYCTPFSPFLKETFKSICETIKNHHSGIEVIRNYSMQIPTPEKYMDQFLKTKTLVQNHIIYNSNCICEPLFREGSHFFNKLSEINNIFGIRLPNDVYFYISQGVISQQVINNFVGGLLVEPYPPSESEEFRKMLDYLKNLRSNTIGLLAICLNHELKTKNVKTIRWYDPKESDMYIDFAYIHSLPKKLSENVKNQIKSAASTSSSSSSSSTSSINYQFVAKTSSATESNGSSPSTTPNGSTPPYEQTAIRDMDEALYLTLQQSMYTMGYNNPVYSGILKSIQNPKLHEPTILFIELLRAGVITTDKLNFIPKPNFPGIPAKPATLLLSRVLSLIPIQCDTNPWGGPIDNDLMGFHEIVRSLYKSIRNLLELASLSNFITQRIILPPNEYFNFSLKLPFFLQPSAAMGLIVKCILLENPSIEKLGDIFPNPTNLKSDLETANEFWDIVMNIVTELNKSGGNEVKENLLKVFTEADQTWKSISKK